LTYPTQKAIIRAILASQSKEGNLDGELTDFISEDIPNFIDKTTMKVKKNSFLNIKN